MDKLFDGRLLNEVDLTEGRKVLVHFIKTNRHKTDDEELQKQVDVVEKYCHDNPIKRSMTLASIGTEYTGTFTVQETDWKTSFKHGREVSSFRVRFIDDDGCIVSVQSKKRAITSLTVGTRVSLTFVVNRILTSYLRGEKEFITVGIDPTIKPVEAV